MFKFVCLIYIARSFHIYWDIQIYCIYYEEYTQMIRLSFKSSRWSSEGNNNYCSNTFKGKDAATLWSEALVWQGRRSSSARNTRVTENGPYSRCCTCKIKIEWLWLESASQLGHSVNHRAQHWASFIFFCNTYI